MTKTATIPCLFIFADRLARMITRTAPDGQKELEKASRRAAARRSVDNLLRASR